MRRFGPPWHGRVTGGPLAARSAELPKLRGGVWHPYRRLWATERKHLPDLDVAAAGGWRDTRALPPREHPGWIGPDI